MISPTRCAYSSYTMSRRFCVISWRIVSSAFLVAIRPNFARSIFLPLMRMSPECWSISTATSASVRYSSWYAAASPLRIAS